MFKKRSYLLLFFLLFTHSPLFPGLVEGTLVKTPDGLVAIENLKEGDYVIARESEKTILAVPIVAIQRELVDTIYEVKKGECTFYTSGDQKLYDPVTNAWVLVKNIGSQSVLIDSHQQHHTNIEISKIDVSDAIAVYEISLAPLHTFFISPAHIKTHNFVPVFMVAGIHIGSVYIAPIVIEKTIFFGSIAIAGISKFFLERNRAARENAYENSGEWSDAQGNDSDFLINKQKEKKKEKAHKENSQRSNDNSGGSGGSSNTDPNDPKKPNDSKKTDIGGVVKKVTAVGAVAEKVIEKVNNMQEFLENTKFGQTISNYVIKTNLRYHGQAIYKAMQNIKDTKLKAGDQFYLDALHKDHLEIFHKNNLFKTVLNLDGSINIAKEAAGAGRILNAK